MSPQPAEGVQNPSGLHFDCSCDFNQPNAFRRYMASLNVCASRALARLVQRGLLVKIKSKWVGYSDVFVDPNNTDEPPSIRRRTHSEEAVKFWNGSSKRLISNLTVACEKARILNILPAASPR